MKFIILYLSSLLLNAGNSQDMLEITPRPERCVTEKMRNAPDYRIGKVMPTGTKPVEKFLLISIKPEDFTREKMIALAQQLNHEFCKEKRFGAIIFDDYRAARLITYVSNTRHLEEAERGFYHINRKKREEYIR